MIVFWAVIGALCAATAGILLYRWGVSDGITICKRAGRTAPRKERRDTAQTDEQLTRQLQEISNFMQYDGGEMPRANGGV